MTAKVNKLDIGSAQLAAINQLIDQLQIDFARLDAGVFEHWFASSNGEEVR